MNSVESTTIYISKDEQNMDATRIKNCTDIELLENWESKAYRDCANINNCADCFHTNENDLCDLELCTRRINELCKKKLRDKIEIDFLRRRI